ncbi:MAG TPA: hypothetical protein VMW24_17015 [Sedimentisphaerales bacterium]|nr:hypothetical protein [Sedimentisphaerales bacterium]
MKLSMVRPVHYQIEVQGGLERQWSGRLGGMTISVFTRADGSAKTILVGELADQAALMGVLNALYTLRLPLLSVQCLSDSAGC